MENNVDAQLNMSNETTIEELKNMEPVDRTKTILTINVIEKLTAEEDGIDLNEGYEYEINGSLPQLADGIAKMLIEMDKQEDMGENAGGAFLNLIQQYYLKAQA